MAHAKYTVHIPTHDNLGNELQDVATAAHHWLFFGPGPKVEGSYIEGPVRGNWRDHPQETFHNLVTVAEDSPEMDGTIKQLAHHVGEYTNQWGVYAHKIGKNGVDSWIIPNTQYREGEPAEAAIPNV